MGIMQRLRDFWYAGFFLVHLCAATLIDSQVFLPRSIYPQPVAEFFDYWIKEYKDPLLGNARYWTKALLLFQFVYQVPYLLAAIVGSISGAQWMRTPTIVYATSVITMAIPMIGHVLFDDFKGMKHGPTTQDERYRLAVVFGGFALQGLVILADYALLRGGPTAVVKAKTNQQNQQKKRQ